MTYDFNYSFQCSALALNLKFLIASRTCIQEILDSGNKVVLTKGLPKNDNKGILIRNIISYNNGNQNKMANFMLLESNSELYEKYKRSPRPICIPYAVSLLNK